MNKIKQMINFIFTKIIHYEWILMAVIFLVIALMIDGTAYVTRNDLAYSWLHSIKEVSILYYIFGVIIPLIEGVITTRVMR